MTMCDLELPYDFATPRRGYEDANDRNRWRHDPIYKLACARLPLPQQDLLTVNPPCSRF